MSSPQPPTILYVDDDSLNRLALSGCLQEAGFVTREAGTGREALRLAVEGFPAPDLIILDVNLPDLDGFEVCRQLRADPATASIPVLHLSGFFVDVHDKAQALEAGADGYLTKPADPQEVIATVRALLRTHRAEEAARAAARAWQATFDAIGDALLLLDAAGTVVRCNRASSVLLGRDAGSIVGRPCRILLHEAFGVEAGTLLDVIARAAGQGTSPEVQVGGRWLWVLANSVPGGLVEGGQVLVLADVTARHLLEARVRHADKLEAVGRLAGGVAHEFNNLLTGVIGNLSLVLQTTGSDDARCGPLRMAEAAAWRAAALTRQLLGFARRSDFHPRVVDLNACVREAATLLRPALGPTIQLTIAAGEGLDHVWADPGGVVQVLMNLCLNARDAMPRGGTVFVETATASPDEVARVGRSGGFLRLRVRDTGPGLSPLVESHLFEPFFTTKGVGEGTGLGLAVVYGVVREHGGWIECRNTPGQGACFDVYLPQRSGADDTRSTS
jgi:two-component system, cell cycle sensor histidine kinase and response regulator CckA